MPAGLLRTDQRQHLALLPTPAKRRWFAVFIVLVLAAPWYLDANAIDVLNMIAIMAMVTIPLNLLTGVSGQISLGPAAMLAVGAFTTGILSHEFGLGLPIAILVSVIVGGIVGFLVGLPSLRLRGLYLVLATLALHFIVTMAASEYQFGARLNTGIVLPSPTFGDYRLRAVEHWYYVLVAAVAVIGVIAANLQRHRVGRAWMAIRDRDLAAASIGVNVAAYKLWAFVVASALNAVAGAFYAYYVGVVTVEAFTLFLAIQFVAMIIIGGLGSVVAGSLLGTVFVRLVLESADSIARSWALPGWIADNVFSLNAILFGALMIAFLLAEPKGLVAIWARVRDYLVIWPFRFRPSQDS